MTTLNEAVIAYTGASGYNEALRVFASATSSETTNEALIRFLGGTGTLNERWHQYFDGQGVSEGTLNERMYEFFTGATPPGGEFFFGTESRMTTTLQMASTTETLIELTFNQPSEIGSQVNLFTHGGVNNAGCRAYLLATGTVAFIPWGGGSIQDGDPAELTDNVCRFYWDGTGNGGAATLQVNGGTVYNGTCGAASTTNGFWLGARNDGGQGTQGVIKNVKVWFNDTTGAGTPDHQWDIDEGSGTTANDTGSPGGFPGTLVVGGGTGGWQ